MTAGSAAPHGGQTERAAERAIIARLDATLSRYGGQPVSMDIADALVPVIREIEAVAEARGRADAAAKIEELAATLEQRLIARDYLLPRLRRLAAELSAPGGPR